MKDRPYKLLGNSMKKSVDFAAVDSDSEYGSPKWADSPADSPPPSPRPSSPSPRPSPRPSSPSPKPPRSPSPMVEEDSEEEAVNQLISLAQSAERRPSVKHNVDFESRTGKEGSSSKKAKGKARELSESAKTSDEVLFDFASEAGATSVFHLLAEMFTY